jgi:excisionase family DNA binding protein
MLGSDLKRVLSGTTTTVETAGRVLGISRNAAYQAVRNGEIPSIRMARRVVVPTTPLRRMLGLDAGE